MHSLFRVSVFVDLLNKRGKRKFVLGLVWKAVAGLVWKVVARFDLCHLES